MNNDFSSLGLQVPNVLLPTPPVDLAKWAVVACDQYTSQPEYWEEVARLVGPAPSTLKLILPEVYLGKANEAERIEQIHRTMREYLQTAILAPRGPGFIFIERQLTEDQTRQGLLVAVDLEAYEFQPGRPALVRATEQTVLERIPPRVRVRAGAVLEVPHVLLLLDDPEGLVISSVAPHKERLELLYDTPLMMGGGRVAGYRVDQPELLAGIRHGLERLSQAERFAERYGVSGQPVLLLAVGDGNHSLAAAKTVWEQLKQQIRPEDLTNHPARYALVELVNLHDPGLKFEPIHRLVQNVDFQRLLEAMAVYYDQTGIGFRYEPCPDRPAMASKLELLKQRQPLSHIFGVVQQQGFGLIELNQPRQQLAVGSLQQFLDQLVKNHSGVGIDYIHGAEAIEQLGRRPDNIGFYLPALNKGDLFKTVILEGVLPQKTFSMGEAEAKRFYMECRRIEPA